MKVVVHVRNQIVYTEMQMLTDKQSFLIVVQIHVMHLYSFLLRSAVIVLGLDFHELKI